jgi:hypothetical protein
MAADTRRWEFLSRPSRAHATHGAQLLAGLNVLTSSRVEVSRWAWYLPMEELCLSRLSPALPPDWGSRWPEHLPNAAGR